MTARRFTWTPKRDQLLREFTRNRFTGAEAARALGCSPEEVGDRRRALRALDAVNTPEVASVPRPVGVVSRRASAQEYPGVCGTAREAPTGSSSGDPTCDTVGTPSAPAAVAPQRARPRPMLIDLSRAPSAMEDRYARGGRL